MKEAVGEPKEKLCAKVKCDEESELVHDKERPKPRVRKKQLLRRRKKLVQGEKMNALAKDKETSKVDP